MKQLKLVDNLLGSDKKPNVWHAWPETTLSIYKDRHNLEKNKKKKINKMSPFNFVQFLSRLKLTYINTILFSLNTQRGAEKFSVQPRGWDFF